MKRLRNVAIRAISAALFWWMVFGQEVVDLVAERWWRHCKRKEQNKCTKKS